MALTEDEKIWLGEKFQNLHARIDMFSSHNDEISKLKVEVGQRPTTGQLLAAVGTAFGLGISFAGLFVGLLQLIN